MIIRVDIDECICYYDEKRIYDQAIPIKENIEKINKLYNEGHTIIYWSSRGIITGLDWFDLTEKQLKKWNCKYHELKLDKPFYDIIICDKSKRIEEI